MNIIISSYNLGSGWKDYATYYPIDTDPETIQTQYEKIKATVAELLPRAADVFCLQEVMVQSRPEVDMLEQNRYAIIRISPRSDTVVAISLEKFDGIVEKSFRCLNGEDVAAAEAIEKTTGKKFGFASAHVSGFNLEEPDKNTMEESAIFGDGDTRFIAEKLNEIFFDCDFIILGADLNAIPEIYGKRFSILEESGYKLERTHSPTNKTTHPGLARLITNRELDYFATKAKFSWGSKIVRSLFNRTSFRMEIIDGSFQPGLDPEKNSSDHIPIYLQVTLP